MEKCRKNIVVMEPSKIIYEGLYASVSKSEYDFSFFHVDNLSEIESLMLSREISAVFVNPCIVQNRLKEFVKIKTQHSTVHWIGLIYALFDNSILKEFDCIFQITEDVSVVVHKIIEICDNNSPKKSKAEHLSKRETDVLQWLAKGFSTKEIADKLNISIFTINTHRKNIMNKTGIRSLAGLTIYAVSKGIVNLE